MRGARFAPIRRQEWRKIVWEWPDVAGRLVEELR